MRVWINDTVYEYFKETPKKMARPTKRVCDSAGAFQARRPRQDYQNNLINWSVWKIDFMVLFTITIIQSKWFKIRCFITLTFICCVSFLFVSEIFSQYKLAHQKNVHNAIKKVHSNLFSWLCSSQFVWNIAILNSIFKCHWMRAISNQWHLFNRLNLNEYEIWNRKKNKRVIN